MNNKTLYDAKAYVFYVLDGCLIYLRYFFRPYISAYFRNLFVSHSALSVGVTSRNHANSIFRSGAHEMFMNYESNH